MNFMLFSLILRDAFEIELIDEACKDAQVASNFKLDSWSIIKNINFFSNFPMSKDKEQSDFLLSESLLKLNKGDIKTCDSCESYILSHHMHCYKYSVEHEYVLCPECDLPEKWSSKVSTSRKRRFYIYFDPESGKRWEKWGHPTKGNPFFIEGDVGCDVTFSRKRKRK